MSSDYLFTRVYQALLSNIECAGVQNVMYSPVAHGTVHDETAPGAIVSPCFQKYDRFFYRVKQKKIYRDVHQRLKLTDFDLLHAHFLFSNGFTAMQAKERYKIPFVVTVRDTDLNVFFKYVIHLRKTGLRILKEASRVVFLSETYREQLLQNYVPQRRCAEIFDKSIIIPNGIDKFWLLNQNQPKKIAARKKIKIIAVGTIEKRKNQLTTVEACKLLKNKGLDVEFLIVGQSLDDVLLAKLLQISFVKYIPHQSKESLIKLYRDSDIFVMPSITETFGLVYAEALSQGLPVLYTRGQGFDRQFEEGEVGYAVDCFDVKELVDKVLMIVQEYASISKRCINLANNFSWNTIARRYVRMYQEILG